MRKRINISIDPITFRDLKAMSQRHGFRSVSEMAAAFCKLMLALLDKAQGQGERTDRAYLADTFAELSERYNYTPELNIRAKRHVKGH